MSYLSISGSIPGSVENTWGEAAQRLLSTLYCSFAAPPSDPRPAIEKDPWGRARSMPHIKTYLRHGNDKGKEADREIAWLFLSSYNFSGAAWGRLEKKNTQLHLFQPSPPPSPPPSLSPSAPRALCSLSLGVRACLIGDSLPRPHLPFHTFDIAISRVRNMCESKRVSVGAGRAMS